LNGKAAAFRSILKAIDSSRVSTSASRLKLLTRDRLLALFERIYFIRKDGKYLETETLEKHTRAWWRRMRAG
jgi:hypothetical protein